MPVIRTTEMKGSPAVCRRLMAKAIPRQPGPGKVYADFEIFLRQCYRSINVIISWTDTGQFADGMPLFWIVKRSCKIFQVN